jgi:hypothetical protein
MFKILSVVFLFVLTFNFIHSEIIEQLEGKTECQPAHDYCKLVEAASVKTLFPDKVVTNDFILIDFICPNCLKHDENGKSLYRKHQNFSFHHLELPSTYLVNQSFLI